jgi:hypothetical protein
MSEREISKPKALDKFKKKSYDLAIKRNRSPN